MKNFAQFFETLLGLGLEPKNLTFFQVSLRGIIVFFLALMMLRMGDKRFLSKKSAFDALLGFILASMLARAINGSAAFMPTLAAGFVIVFLHRFLAFLGMKFPRFGCVIKGDSEKVIENGRVIEKTLRQNYMSHDDLLEDLRLNGSVEKPDHVKAGFVERNGNISVVPF